MALAVIAGVLTLFAVPFGIGVILGALGDTGDEEPWATLAAFGSLVAAASVGALTERSLRDRSTRGAASRAATAVDVPRHVPGSGPGPRARLTLAVAAGLVPVPIFVIVEAMLVALGISDPVEFGAADAVLYVAFVIAIPWTAGFTERWLRDRNQRSRTEFEEAVAAEVARVVAPQAAADDRDERQAPLRPEVPAVWESVRPPAIGQAPPEPAAMTGPGSSTGGAPLAPGAASPQLAEPVRVPALGLSAYITVAAITYLLLLGGLFLGAYVWPFALAGLVLATSIWMAIDARSLGYAPGEIEGVAGTRPVGWLLLGLVLWGVAFPLYLMKRPDLRAAGLKRRAGLSALPIGSAATWATASAPAKSSPSWPALLIGAPVIALAFISAASLTATLSNVPPAGEIWFGRALDEETNGVIDRVSTLGIDETFAWVAQVPETVDAADLQVRASRDGNTVAFDAPIGPGEGVFVVFKEVGPLGDPGEWTLELIDGNGNVLASGTVTVEQAVAAPTSTGSSGATATPAARSPGPSPSAEASRAPVAASKDPYELVIGECFDLVEDSEGVLLAATMRSCDEAHRAEIFGTPTLGWPLDDPYPGDVQVDDASYDLCLAAFEEYVGIDYDSSQLEFWYYIPTDESWASFDDRDVLCIIVTSPARLLTGSVRGTRR